MSTPLHQLQEIGQSVWYDNIRRALLDSGRLREYVDEYAVTGVTSNPSIFERAISGSSDYDEQLGSAVGRGLRDPEELFWDLAVRDIQDAADLLRDVYEASNGADGFVSLELPPRLSRDTRGSIELGTELFARLDRPNVMVKVPGTPDGVRPVEPRPVDELLATLGPGDYLAIQAYGDPGERFGFATLEHAQAAGDLQALQDRGRRAGRVRLEDLRDARE